MKLFIFGFGYSSQNFAQAHARDFDITGCVRSASKRRALEDATPDFKIYSLSENSDKIALNLSQTDVLLLSAPPDPEDPALAYFGEAIESSAVKTIIYLSTIGVYGDSGGAWIDESTPPAPSNARTRARIEAENQWTQLAQVLGAKIFILRLAGIYGPGRSVFDSLQKGSARRILKPGQVFNRIFVDDASRAISACARRAHAGGAIEDGAFNICDDEPAPPQDVIAYAAQISGFALPPEVDIANADMTPMARSFWSSCKRVSNARAKRALGWTPKYRTFREGLEAILAQAIRGSS